MLIDNKYYEEIKHLNQWWQNAELIKQDVKLKELEQSSFIWKPEVINEINFNIDGIYSIRGPRQVGKSTAIKLMIKNLLLVKKVNPFNIFHFIVDRISSFEDLIEIFRDYLSEESINNQQRKYFFIDEISSLDNWQRAIKFLKDAGYLENATIILTGSHSLDIKKGSERLPGRRGLIEQPDKIFYPISFKELADIYYSQIKPNKKLISLINKKINYKDSINLDFIQNKLNKILDIYFLTGGFPRAIDDYFKNGKISKVTYELYLQWIIGDLLRLGKSEQRFFEVMKSIIKNMGSRSSFQTMSKGTNISYQTLSEYLYDLEEMFVLKILYYLEIPQKKTSLQKDKKVFFLDPFIFFNILNFVGLGENPFQEAKEFINDPVKKSKIAEFIVGLHLNKKYYKKLFYYYDKKEVDFAAINKDKNIVPYEVKYQSKIDKKELKIFEQLKIPGVIITKNKYFKDKWTEGIPLSLFLLI